MKRSKRILSLLLSIVMILGMLPMSALAANGAFSDVKTSDWFYDDVRYVCEKGLMDGTGSNTFSPKATTTRGMIVTILYRLSGEPAGSGVCPFSDVAAGKYYEKAIAWAAENRIVSGYADGTFGPDNAITREQLAAILYRYAVFCGYAVTASAEIGRFADADMVGSYALTAMKWASAEGLINGSGSKLDPKGSATRAQAAAILARFCKNIAGASTPASKPVSGTGTVLPPAPNPTPDPDPNPTYTVTFDSNGGSAVASQTVVAGQTATEPEAPTRSGYRFVAWYSNSTLTELYNFETLVIANITLYAKWELNNSSDPDAIYTVTFDCNDGSADVYKILSVKNGEKVSAPSTDPKRNLYRFTGWYEEPSGAVAFDFDNPITGDVTIYAGWGSPDPDDDGLYAATDTEETIYSVSGLHIDDTDVTATINVNSMSILLVEFFEDTLGEHWTRDAMQALLNDAPVVSIADYTPDYGEMIGVSIPLEEALPEYYIARAQLLSLDGDPLGTPFLYIEGSQQYQAFDKKTIHDYDQNLVVNFDESENTNFGVLANNTKKIAVSETSNTLRVADIEAEGEITSAHTYTFSSPDETVRALTTGDIVYVDGTTYLFKVKTAITNPDGTITITPDNDAYLTDFYSMLKVDMGAIKEEAPSANSEIQTYADIIDEDDTLSTELKFPSTEVHLASWLTLKWEAYIKEQLDIKIVYDFKLFGEDYFEFSLITESVVETSFGLEAEVSDNEGHNPLKKDLMHGLGKLPIRTPIPGVEVFVNVTLPIELDLSANASATWNITMKRGFIYNSNVGRNDVKDTEKSISLKAEGKAELTIGPEVEIGIQLTGEIVKAGIEASGGVKVSATASHGDDDITDSLPSKHTCDLCVKGEALWFVEAHVKASYDVCKALSGTIFDYTMFKFEAPIHFGGLIKGKFYFSILPGEDSVFITDSNPNPSFVFGGGECPNTAYRTELKTVDENNAELSGIFINVRKNSGTVEKSGDSTYVLYLHDGRYTARANINRKSISKSIIVRGNAQTVFLSPSSGDKKLTGTILDSENSNLYIENATVKISKDGMVVASAKSNMFGIFTISLPEGTYLVEVSKPGYLTFSIYQTVEGDRDVTQMQTIELIAGSGVGGFHGVITDAVTGLPIKGVQLVLRSGWENSSNGDVIWTSETNEKGEYRFNTKKFLLTSIILGLPCGNYTLTASKNGYIRTNFNIVVLPGETDAYPAQNATMSPALTENDTWRIVLTWGENPNDLDSHMVGTLSSGESFHVYYGHKSQMDGDTEVCNLDIDDTTSYGPETITLNATTDQPYYYYIYRYAGSGTVATSGAQIKVYHGADSVRTFNVPTGLGDGDYWNVFAIVDGKLQVRNTITDSAETSYAGAIPDAASLNLDVMEAKNPVFIEDRRNEEVE